MKICTCYKGAFTYFCTLDYAAGMLGEDPELLEANVYNDDNLNYGSIISVYTGPDDTITALTDDDIDELKDMFMDARITPETWHAFLDDFVDDAASRQSYRVFTQPRPIADGRRCGRNV